MTRLETWQISGEKPELYEKYFVPAIFAEWAPRLANAAALALGNSVLDIACGTGILARECKTRVGEAGSVAGLDLNGGMLAVAALAAPTIEWHQGDATELPFGDGSFDAAVSQFGLMFFPERAGAIGEMWRVLAPGGRLVVAVWDALEATSVYAILARLLDKHAGTAAGDVMRAPFSLGNKTVLDTLFRGAGLTGVAMRTHTGTERFSSLAEFTEIEIKCSPAAELFSDAAFAAIVRDGKTEFADWITADGRVEFESSAHLITAKKE